MEININCDLGESSKLHSTENDPLLLKLLTPQTLLVGIMREINQQWKKQLKFQRKIMLA